jgi:hypothetical protein
MNEILLLLSAREIDGKSLNVVHIFNIKLICAYVMQFLILRTSEMHSALWDTRRSIIHCLNIT